MKTASWQKKREDKGIIRFSQKLNGIAKKETPRHGGHEVEKMHQTVSSLKKMEKGT